MVCFLVLERFNLGSDAGNGAASEGLMWLAGSTNAGRVLREYACAGLLFDLEKPNRKLLFPCARGELYAPDDAMLQAEIGRLGVVYLR